MLSFTNRCVRGWRQGTAFPRTHPSAVTSTVDQPLGSPSLAGWPRGIGFPQLPSAVTSTVDQPLGSPSLYLPQCPSAVTSTVDHRYGSPSLSEWECATLATAGDGAKRERSSTVAKLCCDRLSVPPVRHPCRRGRWD
jgi:hypothetical protein